MTRDEIEAALERAERASADGRGLKDTGFWAAVGECRRDRALAQQYRERIAKIDRDAFVRGVKLRVPLLPGLLVLLAMTYVGIIVVFRADSAGLLADLNRAINPQARASVGTPIEFLAGFVLLLLGSHSLTHFVVGRLLGIRFTHVFLGGPPPPRPGLKTDYRSYLRVSPKRRAVMHASGAVVTKLIPFVLVPLARDFYEVWPWVTWILLGIGVLQIVTDIVLSTKLSDWKKARREWRAAKG